VKKLKTINDSQTMPSDT